MADKCSVEAAKLLRSLKAGLGVDEAERVMEEARKAIEKKTRARAVQNTGESAEEALFNATEEYLNEQLKTALLVKRNALINLNRRVEMIDFIRREFADDPALGIEALTTGVNRAKSGSRLSVAAEQSSLGNYYTGGFIADIRKAGIWKEFVKGVHDVEASRALWRMSDPNDPLEGISSEAVTIARVIQKWQNEARNDANNAGAFIGDLPGYITRQTHDMFKLRQAARQVGERASNDDNVNAKAWMEAIFPLLDFERTFEGFDLEQITPEAALRSIYDALSSGVHLTNAAPGEVANIPSGLNSIAKRMSQERMLFFKDGDAWHAYNEMFGMGGLNETVVRGLELSANQTGLMRIFGPNAKLNFDAVFAAAERIASQKGGQGRTNLRNQAKRLDDIFMEIDGSVRIPGNAVLARRAGILRAIQSMSKLGAATLSAISDIPLAASELQFQGVGFLESYGIVLNSLRKGRDSAEMQELASMLGIGLDSVRGDVVARFQAEDSISGHTASLMAKFFKFNGLSIWTDAMRVGSAAAMSRRLALNGSRLWGDLDPDLVRTLDFFGIGDREWDVIRAAQGKDVGGESFATPEGIDGVDDEIVDRLIADDLADLRSRNAEVISKAEAANARDVEFVDNRAEGFREELSKANDELRELREAFAGRDDELSKEITARISRLEGEFSRAEAVSDIESFVVSERNRGRVLDLLERVEDGANLEGTSGPGIQELAARASDQFSQTRGNKGERLGERRARTERRISQATQKQRRVSKQLAERLGAREADLVRRLEQKAKTFDDFVERADKRMAERIQRAKDFEKVVGKREKRMRQQAREKVKSQLRSYFQDRVDFAVVTPDAKTNAFLNRGTRRGTVEGEFMRIMTQFKSFPIAVLQRPVSRELFARGFEGPRRGLGRDVLSALDYRNGTSEMWGIANLVATTTAMGYMAMSAKDIAKGRTPRDPKSKKTWLAAMTQGGGLGIYGDFLFGEVRNRFGGSITSTLAGPTFGSSFSDLADLWGRFRDGDDLAASAFSDMINHAPFANIFYLRAALDYMILHRIREGLNPGYLQRLERRVERENQQRFLLRPSSIIPRGGGTIGEATSGIGELVDALTLGGEE